VSGVLVLVNPAAGGGRAGRTWERVKGAVASRRDVDVAAPRDREASRRAILEAVERGCERVVAVGGDGTIHLVAGALLEAGVGRRVTIGVVPAGTGSDLARALAIPRETSAALTRALTGIGEPLDAGRCTGERASFYFINEASAGIGGLVDEMVNAMPRRGRTAFLIATLRALRRYEAVPMRIEVDGERWHEGPTFLATVANGTTFGKGMRIAPDALLDDGLFDVIAVGEVKGLDLLRRLPQVYLGKHLRARPVRVRRGKVVRLEPLAPAPAFDADGETYASGPAMFEVLPGALRVAGPP
jgi:diacylglycerol kinase (ATP)